MSDNIRSGYCMLGMFLSENVTSDIFHRMSSAEGCVLIGQIFGQFLFVVDMLRRKDMKN